MLRQFFIVTAYLNMTSIHGKNINEIQFSLAYESCGEQIIYHDLSWVIISNLQLFQSFCWNSPSFGHFQFLGIPAGGGGFGGGVSLS